jgi:hypothetical protein
MGLRSRLFALTYNRLMASGEKAGLAEIRATLLARASGDVLEVGAGTGLNLTHYAGQVRSLPRLGLHPDRLRGARPSRPGRGDQPRLCDVTIARWEAVTGG